MTGRPLPYLWVFLPRLAEQNKVPWESEWDEHPQGRSYSGVKSTGFQGGLTHAHITFFGCMMVYACIQQCNVATNDLRKQTRHRITTRRLKQRRMKRERERDQGETTLDFQTWVHMGSFLRIEDPKSSTTFDRLGNNVWTPFCGHMFGCPTFGGWA